MMQRYIVILFGAQRVVYDVALVEAPDAAAADAQASTLARAHEEALGYEIWTEAKRVLSVPDKHSPPAAPRD